MGAFDFLFGGGGNQQTSTTSTPQFPPEFQGLAAGIGQNAARYINRPYVQSGIPKVASRTPDYLRGNQMIRGIATRPNFDIGMGRAQGQVSQVSDPNNPNSITSQLSQPVGYSRVRSQNVRPTVGSFDTAAGMKALNPYNEIALSSALDRMGTLQNRDTQALRAKQAGKHAFGDQADLVQQQQSDDQARQKNDLVASMENTGFEAGRGQFNTENQLGVNAGMSDAQRALLAGQLNQGAGLQARQIGNFGLSSAGSLGLQGGMDIATLTQQAQAGDVNAANLLRGIGVEGQQQGQANLNAANTDFTTQRDWGPSQTQWGANILHGTPSGLVNTQAAPGIIPQIGGTALSGYALGNAMGWFDKGGAVHMAGGGTGPGGDPDQNTMLQALSPDEQTAVMGMPEPQRTQAIQRLYAIASGAGAGNMPPSAGGNFNTMLPPNLQVQTMPSSLKIPNFDPSTPGGNFSTMTPPGAGSSPPHPPPPANGPSAGPFGGAGIMPGEAPTPQPASTAQAPPVPPSPDMEGQRGAAMATPASPSLPPPAEAGTKAVAGTPEEQDAYGGLIKQLMATRDPKADKWLSIAEGAAAMAASRNPSALGAAGEGLGVAARGLRVSKAADQGVLEKAATIQEKSDLAKARANYYNAQGRLADAKASSPLGVAKLSELERIAATIKKEEPNLTDTEALTRATALRTNEAAKEYRQAVTLASQGNLKAQDGAFKMETAVQKWLESHMIFSPSAQQTEQAKAAVLADVQQYKAQLGGGAPAPAAAPGAAPPAPAPTAKPAASAAPPGPTPPQPPSVPQGAVYSPSRKMWRDPAGKMYDEAGQPAAG